MTQLDIQEKINQAEDLLNGGDTARAEEIVVEVVKALHEIDKSNSATTEGTVPGSTDFMLLTDPESTRIHTRLTHLRAVIEWRRGNYPLALEQSQMALANAEASNDKEYVAIIKRTIGTIHIHLSEYDRALVYYTEVQGLFRELKRTSDLAGTLCNTGIVYDYLADYAAALECYFTALELVEDVRGINSSEQRIYLTIAANCTSNIGGVYQNLSNFNKAIEFHTKALDLYGQLGNKIGHSITLNNLGLLYQELSDQQRALEYFQQAFAIDQEIGNEEGIARQYQNFGAILFNQEKYDQALEYFEKAFALNSSLTNLNSVSTNLGNMAKVYTKLSDHSRALELYKQAYDIDEKLGKKSGRSRWLSRAGSIYANSAFRAYDPETSYDYLLEAMNLNLEHGTPGDNVDILKQIALYHEQKEQWKEANEFNKKYAELEREIRNTEAIQQSQLLDNRRKIEEAERDRQIKVARFREQEKILNNILPAQIAERIVAGEKTIADSYSQVTVFFSDIVGFTALSQSTSAEELVGLLNSIFTHFDRLARKHGLEKIKTIGDAYMAVAGIPLAQVDHAVRAAKFALEISETMDGFQSPTGDIVQLRIGMHSGNVVAGIIGENKFAYDLWGDAVNTANRMESYGVTGKIHVSEDFVKAVGDSSFHFTERGEMDIKGKGMMRTYFLEKA